MECLLRVSYCERCLHYFTSFIPFVNASIGTQTQGISREWRGVERSSWGQSSGGNVRSADTLTSYLWKKINLGHWREAWSPLHTGKWNEKHFPSLKEKPHRIFRIYSPKTFIWVLPPYLTGNIRYAIELSGPLGSYLWEGAGCVPGVGGGDEGSEKGH